VTLVPQLSIHTNEAIKISFSVAVIDVSFIPGYNKTPTRTGRGLVCHFFEWFLFNNVDQGVGMSILFTVRILSPVFVFEKDDMDIDVLLAL